MRHLPRSLATFTLLAGCGYHPGSFRGDHPFVGTRSTVSCLDLAIDRRADLVDSAVLDYQFGNRCESPTTVDLANVDVIGRARDGTEVRLRPYDPDGELRALRLDGGRYGHEALAYNSSAPITQVCVDAASIAHEEPARWVCFGETSLPIAEAAR